MARDGAARRSRVGDWIESRTGLLSLAERFLDEPVPGGARWAYVFGSALLVTLLLQTVTGVLLTLYYVPSVDHAHTTVAYIQKVAPLGWLVRGVHYYGASAVIIVLLMHLAQVFIWGAYKERREALWLTGVVLLTLMLGFGFTGYLLPWDQRAYYGTQVTGGIAASVPVVGDLAARALLGGVGLGQATLSRFFSLHVFVLPALAGLLVVAHLLFFKLQGPAGPATAAPPGRRADAFYPRQFFRDTLAAVVVVSALVTLAAARPALLGPRADPSVGFAPRPEWYFLWAFELLKVMPAVVGGVLVPGAIVTLLALAPFLDRARSRAPRARAVPLALFAATAMVLGSLTAAALYRDANDPLIVAQEEAARAFLAEPFVPDVIGAPAADPAGAAQRASAASPAAPKPTEPPAVFAENCAGCHGPSATGAFGPSLVGITTRPRRSPEDIVALLADPRRYGLKPAMPAFDDLPEAQRREIAAWLATLAPPSQASR
jgi:ubiquinol-cytochrome c reductase cytochrome b subunit